MLITAGEIVNRAAHIYEQNFKIIAQYIGSAIGLWGITALNAIFGIPFFLSAVGQTFGVIIFVIIQIIILIAYAIVGITLTRVLKKIIRAEQTDTITNELRNGKKLFWPFLGTILGQGLIVVAGSLLLLIPGIIFAIWFYFSTFAVVIDSLKPIAAIKKSRELVVNRFGQVLWRIIAPLGFYIMVFTVVRWIILEPGKYFLATTGGSFPYWISISLMLIFYFLLMPILILSPVLLYESLKDNQLPPANQV